MPNPIIFPSSIQWVGLAKEVTYGTAVTPPTVWIPIDNPVHTPNLAMLTDTALRGNMAYAQAQVAGTISHDFTYSTNLYLDTCFYHFLGILGYPDAVTGSVDPFTHKTALLDTSDGQPPSYTLYLFNGSEAWQMAGCKVTSLDVDIKPDGLITLTPAWKGSAAVKVTTPANTPSTALPVQGWNTTVTVASVGTSVYTGAKISLKRNQGFR